ncbi:ATP-binding protein [Adlercreutzia muris]|jgi:predicted AAA+ superfamily ATPase|uniref:ATP-binding protein n=1 Tax=Adlercreutzia muris TaxID=1796610 RepID=UPI0013653D47|nr:AAA family ATPase [Adlercreutzia muris]MCI8306229.1 ATP-binding protein [Enterorhabdus sp.]MCI9673044.1 ATP-binding protein [Enterorhabdus sp.]NCA31952.1 ATP-binding protein [Adlercreutzia muris]
MLKRAAYERLMRWKREPHHLALLVDGARQVGKTYLVREFGRNNYGTFVEINFANTPEAKDIFKGSLNAKTLIPLLSSFTETEFVPGDTLIFFDEIQECPQARTAIKFLVEDGRFDYIESGSLLGVTYESVPSLPVGYESELRLYPLSFEEFCQALGENSIALETARDCFQQESALPEVIHNKLMELFRYYLVVGGMPAAVAKFVETRDMAQVHRVQSDILRLYRADISKYARNKAHVKAIFDAIPAELSKKNKRFKLSDLAKSARTERYESDFIWLADAGVALPCFNVTELVAPLLLNRQHSVFKLFLCDTGLLMAMLGPSVQFKVLQGKLDINWGAILENAFAQILTANGFDTLYYEKAKHGEIDFVVQKDEKIIPIEAKSGRIFRAHASLDNVMKVKSWGLDFAYVFCRENTAVEASIPEGRDIECTIAYMPWYMISFLKPDEFPESLIVELPE